MKYSKEWRHVVSRFGRWIDFDNDYKTLDLNFMESVWYVFKTLYDKGLVYRGRKRIFVRLYQDSSVLSTDCFSVS